MKGIIVVDVPSCCGSCRLYFPARDRHTGAYSGSCRVCPTLRVESIRNKPSWCPIRPMPERKDVPRTGYMINEIFGEEVGWNDCIDSIEGRNENEADA